ncbi:hypothetical protein RN001_011528 [Aquatica leii]|uniref:Retrotransposon gag domain-containing protein n=1 Tax=Aquatica leii TaxID=1421715 RepID=A0AAN7P5U8_9COLE|nr:hypothetical protein RN001_011528 [Aquatica leii]
MAEIQNLVEVLTQFMKNLQTQNVQQQTPVTPVSQLSTADVLVSQALSFEPFDDTKETFKTYRQRLENFFAIKQLAGSTPECKAAQLKVLINCLGSKHYQLLSSLTAPEIPISKTYDELMKLLETHLCPAPTTVIEQHKFLSRMQSPSETIAQYVAALRQLTTTCDFNCTSDNCGISIANIFLRAQFIRDYLTPTLEKTITNQRINI